MGTEIFAGRSSHMANADVGEGTGHHVAVVTGRLPPAVEEQPGDGVRPITNGPCHVLTSCHPVDAERLVDGVLGIASAMRHGIGIGHLLRPVSGHSK